MQVELHDGAFCVAARLLGDLLKVPPADVPRLLRERQITSRCEQGSAEHAGRYRLSFFYRNCRARLNLDHQGRIIGRSVVNYGERPELPAI